MKHALAFGALLGVFIFLARKEVFSWPYYYDEADYMFAASLGWSNYTDDPSQSLAGFIRMGLRNGGDSSRRAALSQQSRAGSDVNFYRHWHGPLYFYWLAAIAPLHLDEHATRSLSYVFPILAAFVIYFGTLWLNAGALAAMLSSAFYLWSYATVFSNELAPHQLFVLCVTAALMLLMKWRATGDPRFWYGAIIAEACAFCTLEVAFVLVLVLMVYGALGRAEKGKSIFLLVASVLFIWPAAALRLSFVKAYLFMAYLALVRKSPWGQKGFLDTWRLRFLESPWEWTLLAIAVIFFFRFCDPAARNMLAPVMVYGLVMLIVLLRANSETPRYMLPFLAPFQIAAGFVFASVLGKSNSVIRSLGSTAVLLLLFWNTYAQIREHPIRPAPRLAEVLDRVRAAKLEGRRLLVPQNDLPMLHYYVPGVVLAGYVDHRERSMLLAQDRFDAVLNPGYPVTLERQSSSLAHYLSQR